MRELTAPLELKPLAGFENRFAAGWGWRGGLAEGRGREGGGKWGARAGAGGLCCCCGINAPADIGLREQGRTTPDRSDTRGCTSSSLVHTVNNNNNNNIIIIISSHRGIFN